MLLHWCICMCLSLLQYIQRIYLCIYIFIYIYLYIYIYIYIIYIYIYIYIYLYIYIFIYSTGGQPQPQGYPTCGRKKNKINSSIRKRPLVVASWNVRTLQDTGLGARRRTALIAYELARYNNDIAALSETRLPEEGSLVEMGTGYTFFWSGLPTVARRIHGVGFAVRTAFLQSTQESSIAIDERLFTMRLPLAKNRFSTFVSVYSPTLVSSDDVKDRFYDTLYSILRRISQDD